MNIQDKPRIVRHELGHWLMATYLGFNAPYIDFAKGHACIEISRHLPTREDIAQYIRDRVQVLMAGHIAEKSPEGSARR